MIKKICILSPVHQWDDVRVFQKQAVSLAGLGLDVTLIARADQKKIVSGVKIEPVRAFYKNRISRFLSLILILMQSINMKADIYHIHNPDTIPIGLILKILGRKVIYDTHEDFMQRIQMRTWIPFILRPALSKIVVFLEFLASKFFEGTIATQAQVVHRLGPNCVLLGNAPRVNNKLLDEVNKRKASINDNFSGFRVVYIGSISWSRGLREMVNSIEIANNTISARLWLIGSASDDILSEASKIPGWIHVDYLGQLSQIDAFSYVARSDVGLIVIHDVGDHAQTDPNKLYEYMTLGIPFIASDFESWKKRLANTNAGWFVNPENPTLIADKIIEASNLGIDEKSRFKLSANRFVNAYNWEKEFLKLEKLYIKLLS